MEPDQQLRNLRDFLLVYNRMTEICFQRCTSNFNFRNLTMDEERCVDNCAGKLIRSNHRLMGTYVQLMPRMVQRRMEEMESKAAEYAKAEEAAAAAAAASAPVEAAPTVDVTTLTTEAPPAPPLPEVPLAAPSPPTDFAPEVLGSISKPVLDAPIELDASISKSTIMQEVSLSAATPLTPLTETVSASVLSKAENGPSNVANVPQASITGLVSDPGSPVPSFETPKLVPLSEDAPLSSSKSENVTTAQKVQEVPPVSGQ